MRGVKEVRLRAVKAGVEDGLQEGEALAMISLYNLRDHDNERVAVGAFDSFTKEFASGEAGALPMVFQHGRGLFDYVGEAVELLPNAMDEKGRPGLAVKVRFDVDSDIPEARSASRQAYKLVKGRRVPQWSYAWEGDSTTLKDGSRELSNMRLSEVSPVLRGALDQTQTLAIKSEAGLGEPWVEIGETLATDPEVRAWLAKANGPQLAEVVRLVAQLAKQEQEQEPEEQEQEPQEQEEGIDPAKVEATIRDLPDLSEVA